MNTRSVVNAALAALVVVLLSAPALAHKGKGSFGPGKGQVSDETLDRICEHLAERDRRDAERGRKHPRKPNKWDALCAERNAPPPPPPPPPAEPESPPPPAPLPPPPMPAPM